MSYATLNAQAIAFAKATPDHAGKSASPPVSFWMEGEDLVILCSDYRKVRATPDQIKQIMAKEVQAKAVMSLPTHRVPEVDKLSAVPAPKPTPVEKKAGK